MANAWISCRVLAMVIIVASTGWGCAGSDALTSDDIQAEIDEAMDTVPLPPGAAFSPIDLDASGSFQAGLGTDMIQFQAVCAWFEYWAGAISDRDTESATRASEMADEIRGWSTYTSSDASLQANWDSIIDQARLGDPSGLAEMYKNNCE